MFLVSKDKKSIINVQQITSMYVGADACSIKADFENRGGCQVGRYLSEREALTAIEIIAESIGKNTVCFAPDDETVRAKIRSIPESPRHHATGKKTKGHGGS